jgi:hypothetical protein
LVVLEMMGTAQVAFKARRDVREVACPLQTASFGETAFFCFCPYGCRGAKYSSPQEGDQGGLAMDWKQLCKRGAWLVYDLITDQQNMLMNCRAEFDKTITNKFFDGRPTTVRGRRAARDSYVRCLLPRVRTPDSGALRPKSGVARPSPRPVLAAVCGALDHRSALFRRTAIQTM